jgi:signal transduction histidine kinase
MVVILGYRRQRNFERVFFFLCLSLFLFYSGSLLALNSEIYYAQPPLLLTTFAWTVLALGLIFLPPLVVHLHLEYADTRFLLSSLSVKRIWLAAAYAPTLYFVLKGYTNLASGGKFDFITPSHSFGRAFGVWLSCALWLSAFWEYRFSKLAPDDRQMIFHRFACGILFGAGWIFLSRLPEYALPDQAWVSTSLAFLPLLPFAALIYYAQRFNFLQIGRQQNLLYAVSVTFFALLYLSLVRRVSVWLEPILPPEASAAILLFVLVVLIEPLQRVLGRRLKETAQQEIDQAQRIVTVIQEVARQGDQAKLISFTQQWLKEKLELADAVLVLADSTVGAPQKTGARWTFSIARVGQLHVRPHGAMLSGETRAALEFLCEQLPAAFDLCRLIEEKLRLERELAERERMAVLGQMAASISHNLKNPLGSIKTILQVQIESRDFPENFRLESRMVLDEVNRLSSKLNQLLQFSRPAILGQSVESRCDAGDILREVTEILRAEADRRGVSLERPATAEPLHVAIDKEALNDIVTNLLVNALDAASPHGHIRASVSRSDGFCTLNVEDDGPGIPPDLQEKILQPFFTTKSQGTGLGLAIVARRVAEAKGHLDCQSPAHDGRGTRFRVRLPVLR